MSQAESHGGAHDGPTRREFLFVTTGAAGAVGVGAAVWPLIDQMNPAADTLALASIEVDISGVEEGTQLTVKWRGKPVFIRHRTAEEIEAARSVSLDELRDPIDEPYENPRFREAVPAIDENRALDKEGRWLVLIGVCTHLGCVPLGNGAGDFGGWFCPCHGSHYDTAGRIRKGPAPRNLDIPPVSLVADGLLKIG